MCYDAPWCSFVSLSQCLSNVFSVGEKKQLLVGQVLLVGLRKSSVHEDPGGGTEPLSTCDHWHLTH